MQKQKEHVKADKCDHILNCNDPKRFWNSVYSMTNARATKAGITTDEVLERQILLICGCNISKAYTIS